jgi:hypothetical protein
MSTTITYLGATGGVGLASLKRALNANMTCIALVRTPSRLTAHFPSNPPNLIIKEGNAHDVDAVAACLTHEGRMVDKIAFSIGGAFDFSRLTIDDTEVCRKGMTTLLKALEKVRNGGITGRPLISAVSTTGISSHTRDVPLLFVPLYHVMLKVPHVDKKIMEDTLTSSGERFVVVRPSLLVDGENPNKKIRVGVEDPIKGVKSKEVGYTISREDVGRWMFEQLVVKDGEGFEGKMVSVTW